MKKVALHYTNFAATEYNEMLSSDITLQQLLAAVPDYVVLLNQNRQIVYCNDVIEKYSIAHHGTTCIGLRLGELFQCDNSLLSPNGCGTAPACCVCGALDSMLIAFSGAKSSGECHILRSTNSELEAINLRVWGAPFHKHEHSFVLMVASDISDEKRLEALEEIFLHDIMNTAGVLQVMAGLLEHDTSDSNNEIRDSLVIAAKRLVDEIQHQQVIRNAEMGTLALKYAPIKLSELFNDIRAVYGEHAILSNKTLEIMSPDIEDLKFVSDKTLLSRVLSNLVKNALEASAAGDIVKLSWSTDSNNVVFTCFNQQHIPLNSQYKIFTRSFSTKGKGRGLGTYGAKMLTERYLKGKIRFTSNNGHGTAFVVTLPITPIEVI